MFPHLRFTRRLTCGVVLWAVCPGPAAQDLPAPDVAVLSAAAEALRLGLAGGDAIWPGFAVDRLPLAIFFRGSHSYLLQHPSPPEGFEPVDVEGLDLDLYRGPHLPQMNANTAGAVAGVITAFVDARSVAAGDDLAGAALILHELVHAFQARAPRGGERRWPAENSALVSDYPVLDPENNAWGRLEGRLLADALRGDLEMAHERVREFLAVRGYRHARLGAALAVFEAELELNEGLADYAALHALSLAGRGEVRMRALLERLARINVAGSGAARSRFYATGAAQALLLDRLGVDWKSAVEGDGTTLGELLRGETGAGANVAAVGEAHSVGALLAFERAAAASQRARLRKTALDIWASSEPLVVLALGADSETELRAYDPMNLVRADEHLRVHQRMLRLGFEGGEVALETPALHDTRRGWLIAALPPGYELVIDGQDVPVSGAVHSVTGDAIELRGRGISLGCGPAWVTRDSDLLVVSTEASGPLSLADVRAARIAAREEAAKPVPAPPFEVVDLAGVGHRYPDGTGRPLALLFFSAAPWAVPAQRFVRELLSGQHGDPELERLLLVATQCDEAQLAEILPSPPPGASVVLDADQSLRALFGVTTLPTLVWIRFDGSVEPGVCGFGPERIRALVERLRDS